MSTTPEGRVKEAVRKFLKVKGVWYFQPMQNGMGVVGIPDFICCWRGQFIAIETKAPGKANNLTANQVRVLSAIQAHDGWAVVVDDVAQVEGLFRAIATAHVLQGWNHAQVNPA